MILNCTTININEQYNINRIFYNILVLIAIYIIWSCPNKRTGLQIVTAILCPFISILYNIITTNGLTTCATA